MLTVFTWLFACLVCFRVPTNSLGTIPCYPVPNAAPLQISAYALFYPASTVAHLPQLLTFCALFCRSEAHSSDRAAEQLSQEEALPSDFARQLSISEDDLKNADTFDVSVSVPGTLAELSSLAKQAETVPGKEQPGQSEARPFAGSHTDPAYNLQLLEASFRHIPQQKDSERPKHYVPVSARVTAGAEMVV